MMLNNKCFDKDLSVIIPCLNEEETIGACIDKCFIVFQELNINGEVIVVDNNSTDLSKKIAENNGAMVINNEKKGYGSSLREGFKNANGEYLIFADADNSYDFLEIKHFWENRNNNSDIIIGSRFKGDIKAGAMPALHRYFGTPFLTSILNLLYKTNISDSQSGMRFMKKSSLDKLNFECDGMEFASELIIKFALSNMKISEIPISLHKAGRTKHKSHLRPFRDGFRHLLYIVKIRILK